MSLQEKAMLANLTIRAWSARKRDKDVGREVEQNHQARDAGNFNKLLIDKDALKPIVTVMGTLRTTHYAMTLPWADNGDRLLPATMYLDYVKKMRDLRSIFDDAVNTFVQNYPTYRTNARKRLGTMYDAEDYPDVSRLRQKFEAKPNFLPVPDAKHFYVDVGDEEVATIRADIEAQIAKQQEGAVNDLWSRLHEVVNNIHTRLVDPETVFRDSLIDNCKFAVDIAAKLNINNDKKMEALRADIEHRLCAVAPQRLRDDKVLRKTVCDAAHEILQDFPAHIRNHENA